eukprot:CAMPEP_0113592110 /NCGR_PEP_ID=MMETSP0015_2-20120614/37654_1 /TAXON_ID=2838 /ORGANISM="Odontella" /LENGTH=483 /DNA_ID=CAMNT_0000498589 /DNA_START=104 /DNA_END=1555 /DNA_ORIENTATION=+ /assembly_acc=CAM_ASM_000160
MNLVRRIVRVSLASTCSPLWLSSSSSSAAAAAAALQINKRSPPVARTSSSSFSSSQKNFARDMQESCHTPSLVLSKVGRRLTIDNDPEGKTSSLVLVRLAKMMISQSNGILYGDGEDERSGGGGDRPAGGNYARNALLDVDDQRGFEDSLDIIKRVSDTLAESIVSNSGRGKGGNANNDVTMEGIKAAGVLARLLFSPASETRGSCSAGDVFSSLGESFRNVDARSLDDHYLSGLKWAYDCLSLANGGECGNDGGGSGPFELPDPVASRYASLNLPFHIRPGFLSSVDLTVSNVRSQANFRTEEIQTTATNRVVRERRQTAWEGDDGVPGFAYSGKVMETGTFSPIVRYVRDELDERTGRSYDCCLLNLYPDGDSGMRYHIDPEQGDLWGYETAVVSVGAARRFAFREVADLGGGGTKRKRQRKQPPQPQPQPHNFVVMDGDVVEMFDDCQARFQHTVKTAEGKRETAPRCSMVFKQCLQHSQ